MITAAFCRDMAGCNAWQNRSPIAKAEEVTDADGMISASIASLGEGETSGDLSRVSGVLGREVKKSLALCVTHFCNHRTHYRRQLHAILTAAGVSRVDTDLFPTPEGT